MDGYKHYIRVNEAGIIVHGFSDAFEQAQEDDVVFTEDAGRHFQIPLLTDRGQFRYKLFDGQMIERTQDELDAEWAARPPAPPSSEDKINQLEEQLVIEREDKLMLMEALADVYEMVLTLQSGGGAA
jgi:hypothetical protein